MFPASRKIMKSGGAEPDPFEASISQALLELETTSDVKSQLRELNITKAKRNWQPTTRKYYDEIFFLLQSIIIYVPMPKLKAFQKIQTRLVCELEKKFSGYHVMFIGERKILPKPTRKTKNMQKRPRSRTLTNVYDSLLQDLLYPVEIIEKQIRVKLDGSQLIKINLIVNKKEQCNIKYKVDTFSSVYKKLTGRNVTFEFPEPCD